jgi:hypothetical protein
MEVCDVIVRQAPGRLRLTLQTDHALLAGEIAAVWGGHLFSRPEPMRPIRLAVDLHDEGWAEVDAAPRVNPSTQRPYDFRDIPQDLHVDAYGRCVQRALEADPYAGLLVSLHGAGLYRRRYGYLDHLPIRAVNPLHQADVDRFLAAQADLQERLIAQLAPDPTALWTHYRWLQVWDMISVFLCMFDPDGPAVHLLGILPRYPGGPEVAVTLRGAGHDSFRLHPWPLTVDRLTLTWPARWVEDRPYESDQDLQGALARAPVALQTVQLIPQ